MILAVAACANGQVVRTMSVWNGGNAAGYSVSDIESITFEESEGNMVINGKDNSQKIAIAPVDSITLSSPYIKSTNKKTDEELTAELKSIRLSYTSYKAVGKNNPLMGHKFGADPFGMVDGDRLYVYMTDDHLYRSTDGKPITGAWDYSDCKKISIISSDDLVNWTDHGEQPVAGKNGGSGPAKWASNMWAPCAAHKTINGKERYFLYFADSSNGIGVLYSDNPYGPWKQPSGMNQLISRSTPNCGGSAVPWLFDPAVLVDDDGKAYLYFGGGIDGLDAADPGSARCVQLGNDMMSIVGTPKQIKPPYLYEDAGINKVGGKYIYSYCSNFNAGSNPPGSANIAYMVSDNPLGPFSYVGKCFDNPAVVGESSWVGGGGNNHHAIVEFKGKYYILYHTRTLKAAMRATTPDINDNVELRSTCMSEIKVDTVNARITNLTLNTNSDKGVAQIRNFNPYRTVPGPTMAWVQKIKTKYFKSGSDWICTAEMEAGSWIGISKVDFEEGAAGFTATVKGSGLLAVTIDYPGKGGKCVALAEVDSPSGYTQVYVPLQREVTGVKEKLYLTSSNNISLKSWSFIR